jgi:cyclase
MKLIRIIPVLLANKNFLLKGENFDNHKYIGDVYNAVKIFSEKKAHELILLDIFASKENRTIELDLIKKIKREIFMPLTVGGGFKKAEEVDPFINEGVEKICLNSILKNELRIIEKIANKFGSQSVVVSVDVRKIQNQYKIFYKNGSEVSNEDLKSYLKKLENMGAGEIILTSIDNEGKRQGYDLELYNIVDNNVDIPIIANGGAKNTDSFENLFENTGLSSCAAGAAFVFFGERKAVLINYPSSSEIENLFYKYE